MACPNPKLYCASRALIWTICYSRGRCSVIAHLLKLLQVRSGEVARILADLEASDHCVAAALLHNALESSMLTEQKLREAMCPEVCDIVCNVAKMSDICKVGTSPLALQGIPHHLLLACIMRDMQELQHTSVL